MHSYSILAFLGALLALTGCTTDGSIGADDAGTDTGRADTDLDDAGPDTASADSGGGADMGEPDLGSPPVSIGGLVVADEGVVSPGSADLVVAWTVSSGSPDYEYIAGTGSLTAEGFDVDVSAPVPDEALNQYDGFGLGVGLIVAFNAGDAPAQGRLSGDAEDGFYDLITGASPRYALIYRDGEDSEFPFEPEEEFEWPLDFPQGLSCGRGVPAPDGATFDSFEPVSCDLLELRFGDVDEFEFVNWT